jgi:hypothetical protein
VVLDVVPVLGMACFRGGFGFLGVSFRGTVISAMFSERSQSSRGC